MSIGMTPAAADTIAGADAAMSAEACSSLMVWIGMLPIPRNIVGGRYNM